MNQKKAINFFYNQPNEPSPCAPNQVETSVCSIGTYESGANFSPTHNAINQNIKRRGRKFKWHYSLAIAEEICALIVEGASVEAVSKRPGIPSRWVIDRWRWEQEEFNSMIADARELRRQLYEEKMIEMLDYLNLGISISIAQYRLKLSFYKWAAKVCGEPATFGKKRYHYGYSVDTGFGIVAVRPKR
jgi:hypothetical protein